MAHTIQNMMHVTMNKKKQIVVLGGGFAGIECIKKLEKYFKNETNVEIILVSEDNFLLFTPMLPQVASGMIETRNVVMPIRAIAKKAIFYEGRIKNIDPHRKSVDLWGEGNKRAISLHYDYLVIALGSETNFFGMNDLRKNAYQMKTLNDAVLVRNRVIDMLERAENETEPALKKNLLTFVMAGGGFAGVETAGEIMDFLLDAIKYYRNVSSKDIRVVMLQALPNILPGFADGLAKFALKKLRQRGIEIQLNTAVTSFDGKMVMTKKLNNTKKDAISGSEVDLIQTHTVIWTAGVTPVNIIKRSLFKTVQGKIIVNDDLEVQGFSQVFAIGDCALAVEPQTKIPFAPTAQLAEAHAKVAAHNIYAIFNNKQKKKFRYKEKGQMAVIGKRTGIALLFGINIHGVLAWIIWRNVYISKIPTWNKRFRVFLDWMSDVLFDRDVSRLKFMTSEPEKEYKVLDEVDDVW